MEETIMTTTKKKFMSRISDIYAKVFLYGKPKASSDIQECKQKLTEIFLFASKEPRIDLPEIYWLWEHYLRENVLAFEDALEMARDREAMEIKETEEELLYWLHGGTYNY
jgi:hypothetical protein